TLGAGPFDGLAGQLIALARVILPRDLGARGQAGASLLYEVRARVGPIAHVFIEAATDRLDVIAIALAAGCPLGRQVGKGDGPRKAFVPVGQYAPFLDLAGTLRDRIFDALAGIHLQVLQVGLDPVFDAGERLARLALAGCAKAREIVL